MEYNFLLLDDNFYFKKIAETDYFDKSKYPYYKLITSIE
jgi:hypothetical protein